MSAAGQAKGPKWAIQVLSRAIGSIVLGSAMLHSGSAQAAAPDNPPPVAAQPDGSKPRTPAPNPAFNIWEYNVEGNTVLAPIDVERAVMPFLGENKTIKDVEAARAQLERVYHDRGYKTVQVNIPQQKVTEGLIRLSVAEGRVGKLKIAGSRYHSLQVIKDKFPQLNPGVVPDFDTVQKEMGAAGRTPDLQITPVLRASATPGRVDVELAVHDELPLHAMVDVNNRYSAQTTHLRTTGELRYDNLFQRNQSISFQYQVAPLHVDDAKIWSASYVIPTAGDHVWALYAVHSDSNVAAVGNLNVLGKGNIYGVRFISTLATPDPDFYHSFTAGLDYKDFGQSVFVQGATDSIESPISYYPVTLEYSGTWMGAAPKQGTGWAATSGSRDITNLDLNVSFIVRGLGTNWREFANKRAGAGTSYLIFRPALSREQVLPGNWSVYGKIDGQLASGPLINNEQYSAGGADTVRGYLEAERVADNAAHATVEVRTPQLLRQASLRAERSYVFLFGDVAKLQILEPLPGQDSGFTLASAGIGLRFKAHGLTVSLDGAHIFKGGYLTPAGRMRGLFDVSYSY